MNRYDILDAVFDLAITHGAYYNIWQELRRDDEMLLYLEKQHFADIIDLIEFLEN